MTYYQLEKFRELLGVIELIWMKIDHTGGLKSTQTDKVRTSGGAPADTIGNAVIEREELREKLIRLEKLKEAKLPEVEKTITAAAAAVSGKKRVATGLCLRMRYLSGRDWDEIAKITGIKNGRQLVISSLDKLEDEGFEKKHTQHPENSGRAL